jgi:hypothetical protein
VPGYEVEPLNYDDLTAAEAAGEKDWPIVVNGRFIKIPLATLLDGIEPKPKRQARKSATAAGHTIVNIDKSIHVGGDVTASQLAQTLQDSSNETG